MDKASVIGSIVMTVCCMVVFWKATHGNLIALWSDKGAIMVIGGTIAVIFMAMPMKKIAKVPGYCRRYFFFNGKEAAEIAEIMYALAEKARRDGILALETELQKINDEFLAQGLKMAVDGSDPETIEATLRMQLMAMQDRHKAGKKFFDLIKVYGPGIALTATLIGQIGMFQALGGAIEIMGKMLAVAVVATMYGTVLANCIAGPIGDKLAMRSAEEILSREMMIQGILSIQAGDNPRATLDKMAAFASPTERSKIKVAA
ncbi:MAG: MotA/TolQ/ExbB proton channel family protein [Phycisphaerales bacterium]|nr:MotA/TolQ/ExbB proton channel family protein [Phycisphaerales bacterium]